MGEELLLRSSETVKKLSETFPVIDVRVIDAVELEGIIVLACEGKIGSLIGRKGTIVSELSKQLGKKVRVIEYTKDERKMVQDLLGNVRLIGVNKIFATGGVQYKIVIQSADQTKLPDVKNRLEDCISGLLNGNATIEFI